VKSSGPLVSVIIPTYNHAGFLREALQSVCAQTLSDWEVIVVNNYSEDDTVEVVESFADARIRLENFRNKGVIAASRNRGIFLARAKYLAFLDSDDIWYPEKLERCLTFFKGDVGLVAHGLRWIGEEERDVFCGPSKRATFDALLNGYNCITPSAMVVRKDHAVSVGCFPENPVFITAEDYHFSIKLARAGVNMCFMKEILGEYRVHEGNMSASFLRQMDAGLQVFMDLMPVAGVSPLKIWVRIRRRHCVAYYGVGRALQRRGSFAKSCPMLFRALLYYPFFIRTYAALLYGLLGSLRPRV